MNTKKGREEEEEEEKEKIIKETKGNGEIGLKAFPGIFL